MSRLQTSIDELREWAATLPGCRVRLGEALSDADIDAAFAKIVPHHPSPGATTAAPISFRPRGSYREFLRMCNGLAVEVEVDGEWQTIDDYQLRVFDLDTIARVQAEVVYFRSPEFQVGAGKTKREVWLSRNHLLAFAGGKYAPDVLWVFDTGAAGDEHPIFELEQDAGFGGPSLLQDEHGNWLDAEPAPVASSFDDWLASFVARLRELDPREYV